jgi:hypothetical protein
MFEVRLSYCIGFAICFFFICGLLINQGFFFFIKKAYTTVIGNTMERVSMLETFFFFYGFDH